MKFLLTIPLVVSCLLNDGLSAGTGDVHNVAGTFHVFDRMKRSLCTGGNECSIRLTVVPDLHTDQTTRTGINGGF